MANNGDGERLEKLELALRGGIPPTMQMPDGAVGGHDFMARISAALDLGRSIAQSMRDLGDYDSEETAAFVRGLEAQVQEWAGELLKRKRRNLADLERIVGTISK